MANRDPRPVLYAKWSKKEKALLYGGISKQDGGILAHFFEGIQWPDGRNLAQELEARGYDLKSLKLTIRRNHALRTQNQEEVEANKKIQDWLSKK